MPSPLRTVVRVLVLGGTSAALGLGAPAHLNAQALHLDPRPHCATSVACHE